MADLNYCVADGWLVGPQHIIPSEPFDFHQLERFFTWGCNNLVCRECGATVGQIDGYSLASADLDRAELLRSGDWDAAVDRGWLYADDESRTYLCHCQSWSEDDARGLGRAGHWDEERFEFPPPWNCNGHPQLSLPVTIDGVSLDDDTTVDKTVLQALNDATPKPLPKMVKGPPAGWLMRLYQLLHHSPVEARISLTVLKAVSDQDVSVRARAAHFFRAHYEATGAEQIVTYLRSQPALFEDVQDPFSNSRFLHDLLQETIGLRLLSQRVSKDEVRQSVEMVEKGLIPGDWLAQGLATAKPDWFLKRLPTLLAADPSPKMVARLIASAACHEHPDMEDALVSLSQSNPVEREFFLHNVRMLVPSPHREAILARIG